MLHSHYQKNLECCEAFSSCALSSRWYKNSQPFFTFHLSLSKMLSPRITNSRRASTHSQQTLTLELLL